ncbi:serine/arginine-rich splicing factor 2 [Eurytemora carolleeae]|uniref:serine/arginine-rich splicing factor 2 n=1 Tax=Eurytemora carolleeae TaxID=1294199 RepID=UPI000C760F8E|nr:serine/arginine-rich splicing factor 2 [Eurytemora carolleeae]|eukprot:XP_023342635.1 serine/arginine-rich splicing factor 2-like [Eurytemora affinis]
MARRGPPPDTSRMVSLKVDGLSHRTNLEDLESLFDKYGKVGDVYIPKDYRTKENRGFGFVRYFNKDDAEDAIDALDGRKFDGRELSVQYARYDRPDRDYGGGRGGGGDRGGRGGGRRSRSRSRGGRRGGRSPDRSRGRDRDRSRDRNRSRTPRDRSRDRKKSRSRSVDSDSRRRRHSGRSDRSDD